MRWEHEALMKASTTYHKVFNDFHISGEEQAHRRRLAEDFPGWERQRGEWQSPDQAPVSVSSPLPFLAPRLGQFLSKSRHWFGKAGTLESRKMNAFCWKHHRGYHFTQNSSLFCLSRIQPMEKIWVKKKKAEMFLLLQLGWCGHLHFSLGQGNVEPVLL